MRLLILLLSMAGVGCLTQQEPPKTIVLDTPEKDTYIKELETELKESDAVLTVINQSNEIRTPTTQELIKVQIKRIETYVKADASRVDELNKIVKQNNLKAIQAEEAKTAQLVKDVETTRALLGEKEKQIALAKADADQAKADASIANEKLSRELKNKVLWMLSCIGAALAVIGLLITALTPFKAKGVYIGVGGMFFTASAWILDSKYMDYAIGITIIICLIDVIYILTEKLLNYLKK